MRAESVSCEKATKTEDNAETSVTKQDIHPELTHTAGTIRVE